jgi:hypothetical protein
MVNHIFDICDIFTKENSIFNRKYVRLAIKPCHKTIRRHRVANGCRTVMPSGLVVIANGGRTIMPSGLVVLTKSGWLAVIFRFRTTR